MNSDNDKGERPVYLNSLDIARGLAALAVVLWHWQHFFFKGSSPGNFEREAQPFYDYLFIFYEKGWLAVDFFFVLSGFILFRLYSNSICEKKTSSIEFFVLRFSRLYPLHLLTLFLVAGLQWLLIRIQGHPFVYQLNDMFHFFLNLFFASAWGLQEGFSFNAPIWSVSIEVILYTLFFALTRMLGPRLWCALLLAAIGFFVQHYFELIGRGLFAFYMGGVVFFCFESLSKHKSSAYFTYGLTGSCLLAWGATAIEFMTGSFSGLFSKISNSEVLPVNWIALWVVGLLLPLSILCMAIIESHSGRKSLPGQWLGEISYASYLLHFPLQLIFFIASNVLGADSNIFYNTYIWLGYFLLLIILSTAIYRAFERPMQKIIRQQFYARSRKANK